MESAPTAAPPPWSVELQEAVGVLLHEAPDLLVEPIKARLQAGWPSVPGRSADELAGIDALVEALRPTFVALRHWCVWRSVKRQ